MVDYFNYCLCLGVLCCSWKINLYVHMLSTHMLTCSHAHIYSWSPLLLNACSWTIRMHVPEVLTACILQWVIFFHVQIILLINIASSRRKSTPRNSHGCCCRWKKDHAYGYAADGELLLLVSRRCC